MPATPAISFPHHMDAEFTKTTPFGQRIAHGTLVFSVGVGLTATLINPVAFSYGYDRLRFVKPGVHRRHDPHPRDDRRQGGRPQAPRRTAG